MLEWRTAQVSRSRNAAHSPGSLHPQLHQTFLECNVHKPLCKLEDAYIWLPQETFLYFSVNSHHSLVKNGLGNVNRIGRNLLSPPSPLSSFLPFTEQVRCAPHCFIRIWAFPGLWSMFALHRRWRTCVSERIGHLPKVTQLVRGRICTEITETAQTRGFQVRLYCDPPPQPEGNFKMSRDEFSFLNNHAWAFYIKILGWPKSSFGFFSNILWNNLN